MLYSDFDKLKTFFSALNKSGFHPERMDPKIITPGDKTHCLNLLRDKIPELKEKTDNEIFTFLRDPNRVKRQILSKFVPGEELELEKILDEQTVTAEETPIQSTGEAPTAEQPIPPAGSTGRAMPGGLPSMSSGAATPRPTPRYHIVQQTEPPVGPATAKIDRLAAQEAEMIKAQTAQTAEQPALNQNITKPESRSTPIQTQSTNTSSAVQQTKPVASSPSKLNFSSFKSSLSSGFKNVQNIAAKANPTLKINSGRLRNGVTGMFNNLGGGIGQASGRALGGLTNMANSGRIGGIGGNSIFGRISGFGSRFGKGGGGTFSKISKPSNKVAIGILGGLMLFVLISGIIGGITGNTQTGQANPISGGGVYTGADIAKCQFTRSGDTTKQLSYKSPLLLSYIQEASSLTGIPAVVLAAFIRVESPATLNMTDEQIAKYPANCVTSGTGAKGVMQLQPQNTKGYDETAITNGAQLIGKTSKELTEEDYCDVRKNIIMGAGFILMKMSYKTPDYPSYGDGTKWDPVWTIDKQAINKLANGYYGCLRYGSSDDDNISCSDPARIYSYGDDVFTSIQNCQAPAAVGGGSGGIAPADATDCPIPNGTITCGSLATPISTKGVLCGHCGIGYEKYMFNCTPEKESEGNKYALDIATTPLQKVLLPKINSHIIKWALVSDIRGIKGGSGYIQTYSGSDVETEEKYLIQFQHTEEYSGNRGEHLSGERGAYACSTCGENHIHVQLRDPATLSWLDAAQYFCRQ